MTDSDQWLVVFGCPKDWHEGQILYHMPLPRYFTVKSQKDALDIVEFYKNPI